jgi:transposase
LTEALQNNINSAILSRRAPEDIASEFGVNPTTVRRYARKLGQNHSSNKGGRPTIVSLRTKKYIKLSIIRGHLRTAKEVHRQLLEFGYHMSYRSAINVLKSMNFFAARKIKKPFLTSKHMKQRLQWAKKYKDWTVERWRQVVLSNETKANIWGSDGCKYY